MSDSLLYIIAGIVSAALAAVLWKRRAALWLKIFLVCFTIFAFAFSDGKEEFNLLKLVGLGLLGTFGLTFWKSIIDRIRDLLGFGGGTPTGGVRRGSEIANAQSVAKSLKKVRSRFDIGGVPVPVDLETRSFLFAGSPGSGKSQALMRSLDALESSGARAIIADPSGQYCARFYSDSRGDVIFNPHDARSVSWSPLAEIETVADIPALAKSLVPDAEGESRAWANYAQQFIEAVLEHAFNNNLTNGDIFDIVTSANLERLQQICAGTPAAAMVQNGNERMFASVRASATDAISALRYLDPAAGRDAFSIRRHIVEQRPGWIFLSYQQNHRAGLARLICAALDVASRAVLSLPPDLNRRVIFALDELPLLGKVQSIVELLTNGRKHGAVAFVGLQTVAQLREAYGRETSQTLLACLGSWLVLRVSDAETADFMSRFIGEQEISRYVQSNSSSSSWQHVGSTDSTTTTQQIVTQRAILPSQLQQLQDMCGYFNLAGPTPVAFVRLQYAQARHQADAFAPAPPRPRRQQPAPAPAAPAQTAAGGGAASRGLALMQHPEAPPAAGPWAS